MEDLEVDDYTTKSHKKQESVDEVIGSLEYQLKVKARQTLKSSQGREYLNCGGQKITIYSSKAQEAVLLHQINK